MKEFPFLFRPEMAQAILDGRKTQTRRIVTPHNSRRDGHPWRDPRPFGEHDWPTAWTDPGPSPVGNPGPYIKVPYPAEGTVHRVYPIWRPGDRLWGKEAAYIAPVGFCESADCNATDREGHPRLVGYKVPNEAAEDYGLKPCSPLFLPRWASRITLPITSVRPERLQDIGYRDICAEGYPFDGRRFNTFEEERSFVLGWYRDLWERINGKGSWNANPWVWVIDFERAENA